MVTRCPDFIGTDLIFGVDCNRYPRAKERGPFFCPKVYKPVCGTNDMTYGNKCLLCSAIWETGINIGMKHKGKCGEKVNPGIS
uniref:Kazal-like domain-containing protein n=1 Tax=Terrapene triunguis TaxID=2587831 RepID=A0A674IPH0_9SAUR